MRYDPERLHREIAFLAYHLHWSYPTLMDLEHPERQRWCHEVSRINDEINSVADQPRQKPLL